MRWRPFPATEGQIVTPELIDDADAMIRDGSLAGRHMAALARHGSTALIANVTARPMLLRYGGHALPVTVDDGRLGGSYVASPHSAYVLYAREELDIIGVKGGRIAAKAALALLDGMLRACRINQAVQIDSWLLSTNLHGGWDGAGLSAIRAHLARSFPDHFLILRSLDAWSSPALLDAAKADGWILLPARQVWVVDDLERDWSRRNNCGNDRRALARSGLTVEEVESIDAQDARRIAELYRMLYVGRYSALNPIFTDHFVVHAAQSGLLRYRVARDGSGTIMAVAGMRAAGGMLTTPMLGYDTGRPQSEGLYRIACFLFYDRAMRSGLKLHGSSGAGAFKRNRGAHGVIEYMGVHAAHLPPGRRAAVRLLAHLLERHLVPAMQREGW
jgi:hypothetical protein